MSVLAVVAAVAPLAAVRAAAAKPLFEEVGTLDRFPDDARAALGNAVVPTYASTDFNQRGKAGTLIMIPERRQLWQVFFTAGTVTPTVWAAVVRDLDTFKIVQTLRFPTPPMRATISQYGGDWSHAIDDKATRLFLVGQAHLEIMEIDLRTFAVTRRPLPATRNPVPGLTPIITGGLTYDPVNDDLLILYGGPPANSVLDTNTFLYTLDVSVAPLAQADLTGFYHIRSCSGPLSSVDAGGDNFGWEILISEKYLYVPCHRAGNAGAVVRMERPKPPPGSPNASNPTHREDVSVGPVYAESVLADQASGRLFMATTRREVWIFEASTMSFIGIVATGIEDTQLFTGYGLDRKTGRFYFQSKTFGLGVAEGRFFPIPQARTMPRFVTGHERILSDTATGRVFVLENDNDRKSPTYRIYRTEPAPVPPEAPDPDRNTVDMAEREGVTEPRYFGSGSGYGARVLLAKGVATVPPAPTVGLVAPTAQAIDKNVTSKCGYTDRELVSGRVAKAEYDTGSTAASAIAFDVDGATKQDMDKPSRCDVTIRDQGGNQVFAGIFATEPFKSHEEKTQADDRTTSDKQETRWTGGRAAACSSSDKLTTDNGQGGEFGPSTVTCPPAGEELRAEARGRLRGGVTVGETWTKTTIRRGADGVRSTVESLAVDIDIAGTIKIAEIRSVATSTSNGRPPKERPMSTHRITVRGARVDGTPACPEDSTGVCNDLTALVDTLNVAAGGKAIFRSGKGVNSGLDKALEEGSKRGALTAIQKSAARQASDRALVGDFTAEIPALEMTVFNDNTQWGRARQVYQFAGVATAATYNIVLRPTAIPFDDDPAFTDEGFIESTEGEAFPEIEELATDDGFDITTAAPTGSEDDEDGGFLAPLRAIARGLRLFFTNPRHSLLLLTVWALLSLPAVLSRRRRLLANIRLD